MSVEVNFDGMIGPTHNYSGLSQGNLASTSHKNITSNPKQAALQGLQKMKFLHDLGIPQAVLPPQARPHIPTLRALGFKGTDAQILERAFKTAPQLFFRCCSASSMWAANIATVTPSCDTEDGQVHLTPANLTTMFHRSIEPPQTYALLQKIFPKFTIHPPLPATLADEGAANHTLLCPNYGEPGVHLFVYGRELNVPSKTKFPARQTREASEAIARLHGVKHALFLQQTPEAIDAGVFHNDVISVGDRNLLLVHEKAYVDQHKMLSTLKDVQIIEIPNSQISLAQAVSSYLFNSQLVKLPNGKTALIAPIECQNIIPQWKPIDVVYFVDVRQSMQNGGGPGCLRLRMVLTPQELATVHQGIILTDHLYTALINWVNANYRDTLTLNDLADPKLLNESREALDQLTQILDLGSLYYFQQEDTNERHHQHSPRIL